MKISSREILKENEIKNILKICFNKCNKSREKLRNCVIKSLRKGFKREEIISKVIDLACKHYDNESYLCVVVAIFETFKYSDENVKKINSLINKNERNKIDKDLIKCFKKCNESRKELNENINFALKSGFTNEEILNISNSLFDGFLKKEESICEIIAINQIIKFEENEIKIKKRKN